MMKKIIRATKSFYNLYNSKSRYKLLVGGTRSGKTWAIIQYLLLKFIKEKGIRIIIASKTLNNLKKKMIPDFQQILKDFNLSDKVKFNKSDYKFELENNSIELFQCDDISKWHGLQADYYWFNEANYIEKDYFEAAEWRLPDKNDIDNQIILDYNPSNPYSWVRTLEKTEQVGGIDVFHSTYKDNDALGEKQKKTIENLKHTNPEKYKIYALGEYGEIRGAVFNNWDTCDKFPETDKVWYGLDFGFTNDPTALIKVGIYQGDIYLEELIYETELTNQDIVKKLKEMNFTKKYEIFADNAEPKSIEEIYRNGINIKPTKKGKDSIIAGIDILKGYKIFIVKSSTHTQEEFVNYTWQQDKNGHYINKPIDDFNHSIDAIRYVAIIKLGRRGPRLKRKII